MNMSATQCFTVSHVSNQGGVKQTQMALLQIANTVF